MNHRRYHRKTALYITIIFTPYVVNIIVIRRRKEILLNLILRFNVKTKNENFQNDHFFQNPDHPKN
jgi:hypothetical protein